ncbi:hypothetical protein BTR14_13165 [Rhizobium rhizosphaerae]|uniref:Uncharacterized protein n=1 Tax=Xaviernesmea rhizosphaerae TaxID=1672749 RepID=A0ABX3PD78_9HYPH|nr:hypothetical protein BTR14_13165 [Xaviernesmea rhizosphaerae]
MEATIPLDDREPQEAAATREAALGWAMTHQPTRQAYRRCTGEDAGPTLDRYREWVEENLTGSI